MSGSKRNKEIYDALENNKRVYVPIGELMKKYGVSRARIYQIHAREKFKIESAHIKKVGVDISEGIKT